MNKKRKDPINDEIRMEKRNQRKERSSARNFFIVCRQWFTGMGEPSSRDWEVAKKKEGTTTKRDGRTRTDQESYWHRCTCCPGIIICGNIRKDIQMVLTKEVKCFKH